MSAVAHAVVNYQPHHSILGVISVLEFEIGPNILSRFSKSLAAELSHSVQGLAPVAACVGQLLHVRQVLRVQLGRLAQSFMFGEGRQGPYLFQEFDSLLPDLAAFVGSVEDIIADDQAVLIGKFGNLFLKGSSQGGGVGPEFIEVLAYVVWLAGDFADLNFWDCVERGLVAPHGKLYGNREGTNNVIICLI